MDISRQIAARFARSALGYFLVIGVLGAWLRARFAGLFPLPLSPANVIHAHSHVAFFGWGSMALFAAVYYALPRLTGRPLQGVRVIGWQLWLVHAATVGALITFAAGGYNPASIAFSTINGLLWYVFVWVYWKNTAGLPRPLPVPLRYLHVAVALLVLSSLGTWIVAGVTASGADAPLVEALGLHLFLNTFMDGWLVVGLLGLVVWRLAGPDKQDTRWAERPLWAMAVLTPVSFLEDVAPAGLPAWGVVAGVAARTLLAVPYAIILVGAARRLPRGASPYWRVAGLFFIGKIAAHAVSVLAVLAPSRQLFIAHIHLNLLGFFSAGALALLTVLAAADARVAAGRDRGRSSGGQPLHAASGRLARATSVVFGVGVAGMVASLLGLAALDGLGVVGSAAVEGLLQAAFAFAVVALAAMIPAAADVAGRWRPSSSVHRPRLGRTQ